MLASASGICPSQSALNSVRISAQLSQLLSVSISAQLSSLFSVSISAQLSLNQRSTQSAIFSLNQRSTQSESAGESASLRVWTVAGQMHAPAGPARRPPTVWSWPAPAVRCPRSAASDRRRGPRRRVAREYSRRAASGPGATGNSGADAGAPGLPASVARGSDVSGGLAQPPLKPTLACSASGRLGRARAGLPQPPLRVSQTRTGGSKTRSFMFELGLGDVIGGFAQHWQAPPRQEPLPMAGSLRLWQEPLPMAALGEVQGIEVAS